MSTGLTYVAIVDRNNTEPTIITTPVCFNSYEEAYEYGRWYLVVLQTQPGIETSVIVTIKTYGPNGSGYWFYGLSGPDFTLVD